VTQEDGTTNHDHERDDHGEAALHGATLAAATLLTTPYLLTYDSILLIIPMGWFIRKQRHPVALVVIWILCLLPIISYSGAYTGPNTIPIAAIICLWLLHKSEGRTSKQTTC